MRTSIFFLCLLFCFFFFLPLLPLDPLSQNLEDRFSSPSQHHWFGTDNFGRDVFSRVLTGLQRSFFVGIVSATLASIIGNFMGVGASFFFKKHFLIFVRGYADSISSLPLVLLALVFIVAFGSGFFLLVIILALAFIPAFIRTSSERTTFLLSTSFVEGSRSMGATSFFIIFRHIVPHLVPTFCSQWSSFTILAIQIEASLSFLGIGVQPPQAYIGSMIYQSIRYVSVAPWLGLLPIAFLCSFLLLFSFLFKVRVPTKKESLL